MKKALIIISLAFLTAVIFAAFSSPVSGPDSTQYDRLGYNLACGHGFSLSEGAPYVPSMYREPAYPFFLAVIYKIFGHYPLMAVFAQILLHAATALIAYHIARHIFSEDAAFLSGIMVAVFPTLANSASYILSETVFTFELSLGVLLILRAVRRQAVPGFIACGVVFGLLTLTKTIAIFLPVAIIGWVFVSQLFDGKRVRHLIACCACFMVIYAAVVSLWPVRNKIVFDTFSMASRGGMVLWSRAEKIDDSPREIAATITCSFSEYLGKKIFPDIVTKSNRYFFKDLEREMALEAEYAQQGMSPGDIDKKMAGEAVQKILKHPFNYMSYTFVEGLKMTAFTYIPLFNEARVHNYFAKIPSGEIILIILKGISRSIAYVLLFFVFLSMVKNRRIWDRWMVPMIAVIYINLMYSLLDAIGRYAVPLIPLYCVMAASALRLKMTGKSSPDAAAENVQGMERVL